MATYNCGCKADSQGNTQGADFQDKTYGKGMRLYTSYGGSAEKKQRCTVCGKVR